VRLGDVLRTEPLFSARAAAVVAVSPSLPDSPPPSLSIRRAVGFDVRRRETQVAIYVCFFYLALAADVDDSEGVGLVD
jgi:hypothetical protein